MSWYISWYSNDPWKYSLLYPLTLKKQIKKMASRKLLSYSEVYVLRSDENGNKKSIKSSDSLQFVIWKGYNIYKT